MRVGSGGVSWEVVLAGVALAFFALGYRRGVRRELLALVGIAAGWGLGSLMGPAVIRRLNQMYKGLRFFLAGLVGSEGDAVWRRVEALPDPLRPEGHVQALALLVFGVVTVGVYIWSQRRIPGEARFLGRFLGGVAGAVNGALFGTALLRLAGERTASSAEVWSLAHDAGGAALRAGSGQTLALAIVVVMALVVAYGLYSASGAGRT